VIQELDHPVAIYLREVAAVPSLTPLTREEEAKLISRIRKGGPDAESAKKDLVEANLREVVSIAKEYSQDSGRLLDLILEGNLGLLKAATELDDSSDVSFSTHAARYIRQAIEHTPFSSK
jgi:RNA polymerase primary sigma factor